jgi:hypothetical protein
MRHPTLVTSMMATVVLNLHGLMTGFLHMFLRSNTATTALRPKGTRGWSHGRHEIRFWGPNELGFDEHMLQPVSGPRSPASICSRASLIENEKTRALSMDSIRSPHGVESSENLKDSAGKTAGQPASIATLLKAGTPCPENEHPFGHRRKQSYSIFPPEPVVTSPTDKQEPTPSSTAWKVPESRLKDTMPQIFKPSSNQQQVGESTYNGGELLEPPPPLFVPNPSRHRRDSSIQTSVTVEIGLRLSHAPTELQCPSPPRSRRASPLLRLQTNLLPMLSRSPVGPSPLQRSEVGSPISADVRAARMKTLPPIPRGSTMSTNSAVPASTTKLSPTVYSPKGSKPAMTSPPPRPSAPSPLWSPKKQDAPRGSKASWI